MPQKIDLSKIKLEDEIPELLPDEDDTSAGLSEFHSDTLEENLRYLVLLYPDKILFCMKDASRILGQSYEFIRIKIHEGKIAHKSYGARKMIHRLEMARLITEGIKCM